jgi:PBP1b-binding outer membrane lipoprotein LpoB
MRSVTVLAACVLLVSCSPEPDTTGSTNACAAKLYSTYNPKDLNQCVDVCINCSRGTTTTCSTSCTLKGAR